MNHLLLLKCFQACSEDQIAFSPHTTRDEFVVPQLLSKSTAIKNSSPQGGSASTPYSLPHFYHGGHRLHNCHFRSDGAIPMHEEHQDAESDEDDSEIVSEGDSKDKAKMASATTSMMFAVGRVEVTVNLDSDWDSVTESDYHDAWMSTLVDAKNESNLLRWMRVRRCMKKQRQ